MVQYRLRMTYDLVIVVKPSEDVAKVEEKFRGMVEKEGFSIKDAEVWGKKTLKYPVQKFSEGIYLSMTIASDTAKTNALYTRFKLDDTILRSLILKKDTRKGSVKA